MTTRKKIEILEKKLELAKSDILGHVLIDYKINNSNINQLIEYYRNELSILRAKQNIIQRDLETEIKKMQNNEN